MIALLTNDLMFQSRVSGAVKSAGKSLVVDRTVEKLQERTKGETVALVLIDLSMHGLNIEASIQAIKSPFPNAKSVAFGPHVDLESLNAASHAGADTVLTRGQFDRDLLQIIS